MSTHTIAMTINGLSYRADVEARVSLADYLRETAGYTGVHLGCEHGVCGACTVMVNGKAVRSCLMLAVQANGFDVTTIEGLAEPNGTLHPAQQVMMDAHGLQCGFCTPGVVITMAEMMENGKQPTEEDLLAAMSGHLCRCTGYQGIRRAITALVNHSGEPVEPTGVQVFENEGTV